MKEPELLIGAGYGVLKLTLNCKETGLTGITDFAGYTENARGEKLTDTMFAFTVGNVNGLIKMLTKIKPSSELVVLELLKTPKKFVLKIKIADSDEFTGFLRAKIIKK